MKWTTVGHQVLMVILAIVAVAGASTKSVAAENGKVLEKIKQRGTLRVGLEGTYPPFSFQNEEGKLTGYEIAFAEDLARQLGVKAVFKPTKWGGMLAALDSGRLDVVINQVILSEERKKKYDFSIPYTHSGIQALVKKTHQGEINSAADLNGKKVAVSLGSNYEQWMRENVPGADVRTYDDDASKYQDLRAGRVDVLLIDRLAALDLVHKSHGILAISGAPFSQQIAAVAIRKGNEDLVQAIDQAIVQLQQDGTLRKLSETWFGTDVTQ